MNNKRLHICVVLPLWLLPLIAHAEFPATQPFPGITYSHEIRQNPPMRLHWVIVDLTNPALSLHVSPGGPDPDADGPFQTTLMKTSDIAARDALDIAVNGDFFSATNPPEAGGQLTTRYAPGQWARVTGPAMTNARLWSKPRPASQSLVVNATGQAIIVPSNNLPPDSRQVISGNTLLLDKGNKVPHDNTQIHLRTAVGLDQKATRLVLLVVDGRRPLLSVGMSYSELSDEMLRLGSYTAINLDGGGSSALVIYDPASQHFRVLNQPSDGRERAVANVLGIQSKTGSVTTRPATQN